MRHFVYSLMTDKRNGPVWAPFKAALYAASLVYGLAIAVRSLLYAIRIFRVERAPLKVVSVGNMTLGGTGKTPFTIMLSKIIREELKREACVLIRGYGWDEQAMLKKSLPDTPILVGEDRARSADRAVKLYGSSVAVLDDGFQHWELARDLDIVLVDAGEPFGNGSLVPRGVLREPKSALRRADLVVLTKVDKKTVDLGAVRREVAAVNSAAGFLEASHVPKRFYEPRARRDLPLAAVRGRRVLCVSGIGDPPYFEETVKGLGAVVAGHLAYQDHHDYREKDRAAIAARAAAVSAEMIVTTEKDAVKFARMSFSFGALQTLTLVIELEITKGKEILIDRLHRVLRGNLHQ